MTMKHLAKVGKGHKSPSSRKRQLRELVHKVVTQAKDLSLEGAIN